MIFIYYSDNLFATLQEASATWPARTFRIPSFILTYEPISKEILILHENLSLPLCVHLDNEPSLLPLGLVADDTPATADYSPPTGHGG